jgi:hypothetical protein
MVSARSVTGFQRATTVLLVPKSIARVMGEAKLSKENQCRYSTARQLRTTPPNFLISLENASLFVTKIAGISATVQVQFRHDPATVKTRDGIAWAIAPTVLQISPISTQFLQSSNLIFIANIRPSVNSSCGAPHLEKQSANNRADGFSLGFTDPSSLLPRV